MFFCNNVKKHFFTTMQNRRLRNSAALSVAGPRARPCRHLRKIVLPSGCEPARQEPRLRVACGFERVFCEPARQEPRPASFAPDGPLCLAQNTTQGRRSLLARVRVWRAYREPGANRRCCPRAHSTGVTAFGAIIELVVLPPRAQRRRWPATARPGSVRVAPARAAQAWPGKKTRAEERKARKPRCLR